MTPSKAANEIIALAEELVRRGGPQMSPELREFVEQLGHTPGLKAVRKSKRTDGKDSADARRVGSRAKRSTEAEMSKTIDELAQLLRDSFSSDDRFERALNDPRVQGLSKANVVILFKRLFDDSRPPPKSMTKPEVLNAMRRERISRVRSGY